MQPSERIVTQLPLTTLWLDDGNIAAIRGEYLTKAQIKLILTHQRAQFIVADIGYKLMWIDPAECYRFWKEKGHSHVADYDASIHLEKYPNEYAYLASRWIGELILPTILLEKIH